MAFVVALVGVLQFEAWSADVPVAQRPVAAAAGSVAVLALLWRARAPLAVLAVAVAAAVVFSALGAPPDEVTSMGIALLVATYSVGAYTAGRRAAIGALGVVVFAAVGLLEDEGGDPDLTSVLFFGILFGGPWLFGRAIRRRRQREAMLEALALELEREREHRARAAVAEERVRIARELHDVVAHAISVIVVQARGGRRSLDADPDEAREAFDSIELTGRQALNEMRRLVGLLREKGEDLALTPEPSLRHLDALLEDVRGAGLPVELSVEGSTRALPPGVDLSAYRIVQEALTNALKHAGPARARVVVRYGEEDLELEIADTGSGARPRAGGGHGLAGMRERVSLFGGELHTGRDDGGGFAVRARLPLASMQP